MTREDRRLAAIVSADVAGYSGLMGADEAGTLAALKAHRAAVDPIVERFGGRVVGSAGDDIHGDGVNLAARLQTLAEPGGICVSRPVRNQVRDKLDVAFADLGEVEVKNIARPVSAFHVRFDATAAARTRHARRAWHEQDSPRPGPWCRRARRGMIAANHNRTGRPR